MNKKILCVCFGGLGNRLRSLSACHKMAGITGRELMVWWIKDHRCPVEFNDLFDNNFEFVREEFVDSIKESTVIYIHSLEGVEFASDISSTPLMFDICNRFPREHVNFLRGSAVNDQAETLIVFTDNFVGFEKEDKNFILSLNPNKEILDSIYFHIDKMDLNDQVIGVHARGSDFPVGGVDYYIDKMREMDSVDAIFYIASDDPRYVEDILNVFPKALMRCGTVYPIKIDETKANRNNMIISRDVMIDGVIEMYLLAKTGVLIGHLRSSFFQISRVLSEYWKS